jgi:hypothetical protein
MFIISQINTLLHVSTLSTTNAQLFHKLSHCYMFRHFRQQMHNYFTNYHTATCFDTIV